MRRGVHALGLAAIFWTTSAGAATIDVGPGDSYSKIEAAVAGDEVVIQPGTYQFRVYLSANGSAASPIVIRAADPQNRPVWDLGGQNVEAWPGSYTGCDNGRGCWQISGSYYDISGIEIRGCHTSSGNAANIRTVAADHIRVRDVYLHGSDAGFTGDGENISVEFSEVADNGQPSSPPQHNFYIYGGSFALRYSHVHDSVGGQNLHIRARDSTIEYNWIARAANYEVDMMTGNDPIHSMLFRGNVLLSSTNPANGGQVMVLYNDSGDPGIQMSLEAVWNTFVVQSASNPILVNVNNQGLAAAGLVFSNNIVVGTNQAYAVDTGTQNYTVSGTRNWFRNGADVGVLASSVFGIDPGFQPVGTFRLGGGLRGS